MFFPLFHFLNLFHFCHQAITIFTFISVWVQKSITSIRRTVFVVIGIWLLGALIVILGITTHSDSKPVFVSPTPVIIIIPLHRLSSLILGVFFFKHSTGAGSVLDSWHGGYLQSICGCGRRYSFLLFATSRFTSGRVETSKSTQEHGGNLDSNGHQNGICRSSQCVVGPWRCWRELCRANLSNLPLTPQDRYPIVYSLSIMPLSIVRWTVYAQQAQTGLSQVAPVYTFIAVSIFGLSGFFNVILLLTTRRTSGLFGELIYSAPSRTPIILFRNDREMRDPSAISNQSKAGSRIYDEIYVEREVHTM